MTSTKVMPTSPPSILKGIHQSHPIFCPKQHKDVHTISLPASLSRLPVKRCSLARTRKTHKHIQDRPP